MLRRVVDEFSTQTWANAMWLCGAFIVLAVLLMTRRTSCATKYKLS